MREERFHVFPTMFISTLCTSEDCTDSLSGMVGVQIHHRTGHQKADFDLIMGVGVLKFKRYLNGR